MRLGDPATDPFTGVDPAIRPQITWVTTMVPSAKCRTYVECRSARDPLTSVPQDSGELPTEGVAGAEPTVLVESRCE